MQLLMGCVNPAWFYKWKLKTVDGWWLANVNVYSRKFITIADTRFKQGTYANKIKNMPLPPPKNRTAYGKYLYFVVPNKLEIFLQDYRQILMAHFRRIEVEGGSDYWTCGQDHDPRNWDWEPWQHLERLCRNQGLDDFAVRASYYRCRGRNLEFKYQVLNDGIVENEPRFVFSMVLTISFISCGLQFRKSLLIKCASIGFKLKTVLSRRTIPPRFFIEGRLFTTTSEKFLSRCPPSLNTQG